MGMKVKTTDPLLYINPYSSDQYNNTVNNQPDEFDICWFDLAVTPDILYRLKPY